MTIDPLVDLRGLERLGPILADTLRKAEEVAKDPRRLKCYADHPLQMFRDCWGLEPYSAERPDLGGLTPDQSRLIAAVAMGARRVAARSGHGIGKSFVLALLILWWLYGRQGLVVSTASTWDQVHRVLWREIAELHRRSRVPLPGELLQTELRIEKGWYAVGLSTNEPTSFQGRHHPRLLVVVDEAPGVDEATQDALASLCTGQDNRLVMVGNPTEISGTFYRAFQEEGWERLHFSCLDHPNVVLGREVIPGAVTREWIEDAKQRWGEGTSAYASRVLGEFPTAGSDSVISMALVDRAMAPARWRKALEEAGSAPVTLGVDVARKGENRTVVAIARRRVVVELRDWGQVDTMETVGRIRQIQDEYGQGPVVVDVIGVGGGVVDRLRELDVDVIEYHAGRPAAESTLFMNRRAEAWWRFRRLLEMDLVALPAHEKLRKDLIGPTFRIRSNGKIVVESKEDLLRRGFASSDFADAVMMALVGDDLPPELELETTLYNTVQDGSLILETAQDTGPLGQLGGSF